MSRTGWRRTRLKYVADCNREVLAETTNPDFTFAYVDISAVTQGNMALPEELTQFGAAPSRARRLAEPHDTVISTVRTYLRAVAAVPDHDEELVFSTGFAVLHPTEDVDPRFLGWYLQGDEFVSRVEAASVGVSYPAITAADVMAMDLVLPPLAEQRAIADYLDRETAQIDTLIAKQEQLIATLRERRLSTIANLTLDGFSPLGSAIGGTRVGAHFSVTLGKMLDAGRAPGIDDVPLPYLRAANIQDDGLDLTSVKTMPYTATEAARLDLRTGDLLVVEGGAVGTTALLRSDMHGWSFQKTVNRVRTDDGMSTAWLSYVLRAYRDLGVIDIICDGSTIAHFTAEKLRALRIPSTTANQQKSIVDELDRETSAIDTLIAKAEQFIALAKERRAALITAAVTGQIDVGAAA